MGTGLLYSPEFIAASALHTHRNSHSCWVAKVETKINESTENTQTTNMSPCHHVRIATGDDYAGSAFSMSPSPRALPLPSFSWRKENEGLVDHPATRDLRRILRLA